MKTPHRFESNYDYYQRVRMLQKKRKPVLVSIDVDPKTLSLYSGLTHQFTAIGTYSDKSTRDITNLVEWYSNNPSSAVVSNEEGTKGLTTTIHTGEAQIFARLDGIMSSDSLLTIAEPVVQMKITRGANDCTFDINGTVTCPEQLVSGSVTLNVTIDPPGTGLVTVNPNPTSITDGTFSAILTATPGTTGAAIVTATMTVDGGTVSATETVSMYCPRGTFGFGKGVLLLDNGVDSYDFAKQLWSLTKYTAVQISPSIIRDQYTTGEQLAADYGCVWIGVQGNITDSDVIAMMQPGGILDEFVKIGGIFIVHDAPANPIIVTSSEGFEVIGSESESLTQFSRIVQIPLSFEYLRTYPYINFIKKAGDLMALETNCQTCTPPAGSTPILTVDVPSGLAVNLLGIHIEVCPICVSVFTEGSGALTAQQQGIVNNLVQVVHSLVPTIPGA